MSTATTLLRNRNRKAFSSLTTTRSSSATRKKQGGLPFYSNNGNNNGNTNNNTNGSNQRSTNQNQNQNRGCCRLLSLVVMVVLFVLFAAMSFASTKPQHAARVKEHVMVMGRMLGPKNKENKENSMSTVSASAVSASAVSASERAVAPPTPPQDGIYDVAVLGAGPAGLTAALFAARAGLSVIVLGSESGLLSETPHLDNFPSYNDKTTVDAGGGGGGSGSGGGGGPGWLKATRFQAQQVGANFAMSGLLATSIGQEEKDKDKDKEKKKKKKGDNNNNNNNMVFVLPTQVPDMFFRSYSVVIATGAKPKRLDLEEPPPHDHDHHHHHHDEADLWGKSLHSCAICDGSLYKGKTVVVVGGGDAAMDAAILIARHARKVVLVHRRTEFSGKNQASIEIVLATDNIEVMKPFVVTRWEIDPNNDTTTTPLMIGARIQHHRTNDDGTTIKTAAAAAAAEEETSVVIPCDGAFVMIGATPNTGWLNIGNEDGDNGNSVAIELEPDGLVRLNAKGSTATSFPGVFAAGEVTDNVYKQAITAAAAGAQAAIDAERWLRQQQQTPRGGVNRHEGVDIKERNPVVIENRREEEKPPVPIAADDEKAQVPKVTKDECDLTTEECITTTVNEYPVVVFSKPHCPYCQKALEALSIAGVSEPHIIDLSSFGDMTYTIQNTLRKMTGRRTVPNVFVGGKSIGGGDETVEMQNQGNLVAVLRAAGAITIAASAAAAAAAAVKPVPSDDCDLTTAECVTGIVNNHPVVVFSLEWCPECKRTMELLQFLGVTDPFVIDLDDFRDMAQDIRYNLMQTTGRRSVPNLFIGGKNIGGFTVTEKLHQSGDLVSQLMAAGAIKANR